MRRPRWEQSTNMDRSPLRNRIDSGRATALDCYAIGRSIPAEDPVGTLFRTDLLNKSIILKRYEKAAAQQTVSRIFNAEMMKDIGYTQKPIIVTTVVYVP